MSAAVVAWMLWGPTNVPTTTYRTTPAQFRAQVEQFEKKYEIEPGVVRVPEGETGYMLAQRYGLTPEIHVKLGQTLPLLVSSTDVLHGFSLVGHGENINIEVVPGHAYRLKLKPDKAGTYLVVCNEYCGLGHQFMQGRIVVEE